MLNLILATGGARAGRANVPGIGSLGALGLSGNDTRSGDQVDPSTMIQMLQNPAFTQMMNQVHIVVHESTQVLFQNFKNPPALILFFIFSRW